MDEFERLDGQERVLKDIKAALAKIDGVFDINCVLYNQALDMYKACIEGLNAIEDARDFLVTAAEYEAGM